MAEVIVTGVRHSEEDSINIKYHAESIQDSISAEDIGKLPDATISDSLQRITGVQIDRSGGEGSSINIRGLPQVGTFLNGEPFLTTGSIVGVQPNFTDIPSQLFTGADVIKAPTADLLNGGITGIRLRPSTWTHQPHMTSLRASSRGGGPRALASVTATRSKTSRLQRSRRSRT